MLSSRSRRRAPPSPSHDDEATSSDGDHAALDPQRTLGNSGVGRLFDPPGPAPEDAAAPGVLAGPMPKMSAQVGKLGVLGVVDLNCGWYCEKALLSHWFEKLNGTKPRRIPLPRTQLFGYDPGADHATSEAQRTVSKTVTPTDLEGWEMLLGLHGPIIVSGKLGAADWGGIRGSKRTLVTTRWGKMKMNLERMGVGHYVLIVGANVQTGELSYLDPLQGNRVRTESFDHMKERIDRQGYFFTAGGATKLLDQIGAE